MNAYPPPHALILAAVMTSPRDLEIARLLGWYRIPLKSAPKVVGVDYLAVYPTGGFDADSRWRIQHLAEVCGHELVTRAGLFRDEPDPPRAREKYFKLKHGALTTLPRSIPAGTWRRVTFRYTSGEPLQKAQTIHDLVVRSEDQQVLWRNLRERAMSAGNYTAAELPESAIDPAILMLLGSMMHTD